MTTEPPRSQVLYPHIREVVESPPPLTQRLLSKVLADPDFHANASRLSFLLGYRVAISELLSWGLKIPLTDPLMRCIIAMEEYNRDPVDDLRIKALEGELEEMKNMLNQVSTRIPKELLSTDSRPSVDHGTFDAR